MLFPYYYKIPKKEEIKDDIIDETIEAAIEENLEMEPDYLDISLSDEEGYIKRHYDKSFYCEGFVDAMDVYNAECTNSFRESIGLTPITVGTCKCLRCDKPFRSSDIKKVRICRSCKEATKRIRDIPEYGIGR